jgi:ferredoxin like protein
MDLEDKLFLVRFVPDEESHLIVVDQAVCHEKCEEKYCTKFCPASVYEWDEKQGKIIVGYEDCVECGACRVSCPFGNIEWRYPRGGYGVCYKYG